MRRALAFTAIGLAGLVWGVPQTAAQTPAGDSVVGTLNDSATGVRHVDLNARSDPSGGQPTGTALWHLGGGLGPDWNAVVTCLSVSGNTAIVGFSGTFRLAGLTSPTAGLIRVVDGGGPNSRQDTFEWADVVGPVDGAPIPGPTDCSVYPSTFRPGAQGVNEGGDLVVTDTANLPTTKDQCRNGGWRTYGVFKSKRDCVSFVRHQARQECVFIRAAVGRPAFRAEYGSGVHKRHAMRRCIRQRMND
jgi:hypothetical protein